MGLASQPQHVKVNTAEQTLMIMWADTHESVYPLDGLRKECPCATCKGGHANMTGGFDAVVFRLPALQRWRIERMEAIGHHALRIHWDDGHNAGMYRWDSLREACPCDTCFAQRTSLA